MLASRIKKYQLLSVFVEKYVFVFVLRNIFSTLSRMASWWRANYVKRNVSGMFDTNSLDRWKDNEVDCHSLTRSWCNPFASSWLKKYCNTRLKLCVVCFIKHNKLKSSNRSTNTSIYGWLQRGVQLALVCLHVLATKLRSSLDEINVGLGKLYVWFFYS